MEHRVECAAQELLQTVAAVRLSLKWMGITRSLSARQKEELGTPQFLDARMLSASRKILDPGHPVMKQMTAIKGRIRKTWMDATLPYVESGIRLLPRTDLRGFHDRMSDLKEQLQQASRELSADYALLREDAQQRLGVLYDPGDYPASIEGLFDVLWSVMEVQPPQYLLRLDPELYRTESQRVQERFRQSVELAEQAFLTEFSGLVEHLSERLSGTDNGERKVFRDSAVENLKGFIERFRHLSVHSPEELNSLVDQVQRLMSGVTPQALRTRDGWRQSLATQLGGVKTELDSLMVNRPRRRIVRMEESHAVAS